ncbi:MAG: hypothetical protein ACRBBN_11045 [Methyloligellaceae bacterium]
MLHFDMILYCPLEEEFREVSNIFGYTEDLTNDFNMVALSTKCSGISLLLVAGHEMGASAAQSAAANISTICTFKLFVCLGIAGGISEDVNLGDVCFSGNIIDISQNQKITDIDTEVAPSSYRTNIKFSYKLQFFNTHPALDEARKTWRERCNKNRDIAGLSNSEDLDVAKIHNGTICTGPVSASSEFKNKIKKLNRKMLAIETEVGGIFSHFEWTGMDVITIRGISDHSDAQKNQLEKETSRGVSKYAVRNAADFLKINLEYNSFFRANFIESQNTEKTRTDICEDQEDLLDTAITIVQKKIREQLMLLSPEFRIGGNNYWTPPPRLRGRPSIGEQSLPQNIEEILETDSHILIEMPTSYPDQGAPQQFAYHLLSNTINGRIIVPVFVEENIAPPRSINHFVPELSKEQLEELAKREDCVIVYVFPSLPAHSNSKMKHIISELTKSKNCRSITFIKHSDYQLLAEDNYLTFYVPFTIDSISFANIARFIRKQFEVENIEAESIALRLSQTFNKFDLPVHASYVAGIPKDFLTKLIEANRRSELIELAVTGFLTFTVAGDTSDVRLSRTTRKRFLVNILERMEIDGKMITKKELNSIAQEVLEEYDFDVNSENFIEKFFEYGILKVDRNNVEFSIPFIRFFLLAEHLANNEDKAKKYFNINAEYFDFPTFIIYCELCGGQAVYQDILHNLESDIADFKKIAECEDRTVTTGLHALFDSEISPQLLKKQSAISDVHKRCEHMIDDMLDCDDETEKKQKILDVNSRMRASTVEHKINSNETPDFHKGRKKLIHDLDLGVTLLGAGAEHLTAKDKRLLADRIIQLTTLITDDWFRNLNEIDHQSVKESVVEDMRNELDHVDFEEETLIKLVDIFVNISEVHGFMSVMPSMLNRINDSASHPVLYKSLSKITFDKESYELLRSLWLVALDSNSGSSHFIKIIKKLPQKAFARVTIADYLLGRAYWTSTSQEERINLLALVEEVIAPIGLKLVNPKSISSK